ncbi:hypothetical protein [Thermogemmatispora sp.]|uniref:hypothetical protein n=1 Tax=Thermogemmatispora sp. TaxID=1968838 RepID=UPI0035E45346
MKISAQPGAPTRPERGWSALVPRRPRRASVHRLLMQEGYQLAFWLPAFREPCLPAQYHYRDATGTEVIWLAGPDPVLREQDPSTPAHRSRFWVYANRRDPRRADEIRERLRRAWGVLWKPT